MCWKGISKVAGKADPVTSAMRKQGGAVGAVGTIMNPGGAAGEKFANGAPINAKNMLDPNGWMTPQKPLKDMSAEEQEAERQKRISGNVGAINSAYGGREAQYKAYSDALRKQTTGDLNRQYADANRNLRFELAGSGLTGGSVAADSGQDLGRQMAEGTVAAESKVNEAEAGLRGQDENARLQLISLAQTGGDIGNPALQTAQMLKTNLQNAQSGTAGKLGDVFGSTAATYKAMQDARNLRRGLTSSYEQIYGSGIGRQPGVR